MRGFYQDTLRGPGGPGVSGPWRRNTVVSAASTAIAGLFQADPRMQGGAWLAIGAGSSRWDRNPPHPDPNATRLVNEITRVEVEAMDYVDAQGEPTTTPTPSVQLTARITLPRAGTLREFGVFIGDGAEREGGGVMVNNVIHERLQLAARRELVRRVRFDFLPPPSLPTLPSGHWLEDLKLSELTGLEVRPDELGSRPPSTLSELANSERLPTEGRASALRSIARHLLDDVARVELVPELADVSLRELIRTDTETLVRRHRSSPTRTAALRSRLDGLGVLSEELLAETSLRRLVEG
jgi:hypothetical protein